MATSPTSRWNMSREPSAVKSGCRPTMTGRPPSAVGQEVPVDHLRPALHARVPGLHLRQRAQLAPQLVGLADGDLVGVSLRQEDHAHVHPADGRGLLLQEAEEPGLETTAVDNLLLPFPPHAPQQWVTSVGVPGVDVAAHPERVATVQPSLRGGAQASRQQVAPPVPEDHVGDHLLVAGILLDHRSWHEEGALAHRAQETLDAIPTQAAPLPSGEEVGPPDAEDLLVTADGSPPLCEVRPRETLAPLVPEGCRETASPGPAPEGLRPT